MRPPSSRFRGGLRIGAEYFARQGALAFGEPHPRGVVDHLSDLSNPGLDVARVHPAVARFFEDTAGLELLVRSSWRFPLSFAWRFFRLVMGAIGQFVLPLREGHVATRVHRLDPALDGRPNARAVIRTYQDTGGVMQAVAYATWASDGTSYMSAAFPMPGGQVLGILRLDALGEDESGRLGVALTSTPAATGTSSGVWLVLGKWLVRSPFDERLELWAPGMPGIPPELSWDPLPGATIVGRHEQRLFGFRFVTHHYWFRPLDRGLPPRT